jgi:ABC-2 type transport system permease protein
MRNTWLVVKHQIRSTLGKPSFWIMTFLFPLIIVGFQVGSQVLARDVVEQEAASATSGSAAIGYVDEAGLIRTIPADIPPGLFVAYSDQGAARAALENGDIQSYYLIPADFVASGDLVLVERDFSPFKSLISSDPFRVVINANLVGNEALAKLVVNPTAKVEATPLAPLGGTDMNSPLAFIVPYATLFIFFFVITMSSGFMLQSVAKEKENRVIEVLLVSLRPRELMLGKVIGLGAVALLQMGLWMGAGLFALDRGVAAVAAAAAAFALRPAFLVWALLYFLLGYLLYASLMGALGALAPSAREGQQFVFIILLPLLTPLWLASVFVQSPNAPLPVFLSLFPLTAPVAMITRLAATGVPLWQPLVSLALLVATTYLIVAMTARLFRAQTLLSGATLTTKRIWQALRGQ